MVGRRKKGKGVKNKGNSDEEAVNIAKLGSNLGSTRRSGRSEAAQRQEEELTRLIETIEGKTPSIRKGKGAGESMGTTVLGEEGQKVTGKERLSEGCLSGRKKDELLPRVSEPNVRRQLNWVDKSEEEAGGNAWDRFNPENVNVAMDMDIVLRKCRMKVTVVEKKVQKPAVEWRKVDTPVREVEGSAVGTHDQTKKIKTVKQVSTDGNGDKKVNGCQESQRQRGSIEVGGGVGEKRVSTDDHVTQDIAAGMSQPRIPKKTVSELDVGTNSHITNRSEEGAKPNLDPIF
ncbi:OLC1v1003859C1 [Oldenlandia corymbosa var. corymbosa]|uniref:OLC1v1003859C1 n=1 Tax=Oldenlandia corymbosa var. corymbosa TaxID=529605 RepID=A0AAV1DDD5_OLDCO|nr:OLC1v1003859C1 [Oldenlandia corymbosa var. corymbosa]